MQKSMHIKYWLIESSTCMLLLQSYLILSDPMDCNPASSSVHGILQARILELVAVPSSRASPNPGIEPISLTSNLHWQASSLSLMPLGKPNWILDCIKTNMSWLSTFNPRNDMIVQNQKVYSFNPSHWKAFSFLIVYDFQGFLYLFLMFPLT